MSAAENLPPGRGVALFSNPVAPLATSIEPPPMTATIQHIKQRLRSRGNSVGTHRHCQLMPCQIQHTRSRRRRCPADIHPVTTHRRITGQRDKIES